MARLIQAVAKYGPKVERTRTAPPDHVAHYVARGTGLSPNQVALVLGELHEAILYFNSVGTPVKLEGIGTFGVSLARDGRRRITFSSAGPLRRGMNGEMARTIPVVNAANIGLDNVGLKALWDADHPDDPLEIPES